MVKLWTTQFCFNQKDFHPVHIFGLLCSIIFKKEVCEKKSKKKSVLKKPHQFSPVPSFGCKESGLGRKVDLAKIIQIFK